MKGKKNCESNQVLAVKDCWRTERSLIIFYNQYCWFHIFLATITTSNSFMLKSVELNEPFFLWTSKKGTSEGKILSFGSMISFQNWIHEQFQEKTVTSWHQDEELLCLLFKKREEEEKVTEETASSVPFSLMMNNERMDIIEFSATASAQNCTHERVGDIWIWLLDHKNWLLTRLHLVSKNTGRAECKSRL